jgi:hypothetical protein
MTFQKAPRPLFTGVLYFTIASFISGPQVVQAAELGSSAKTGPEILAAAMAKQKQHAVSYSEVELGDCVPKKDPKTGDEESRVREMAAQADLPKAEILARLIYGESLATGFWNGACEAPSDTELMESIGWGIMYRVNGKKKTEQDPYAAAIFLRKQFPTSFSSAKKNPFAEAFLCPLKSDSYLAATKLKPKAKDLYKKAHEISEKIIAAYEMDGLPAKFKKVALFFYPRSEYYGELRPPWAKNPVAEKNPGYMNLLNAKNRPCVEFYPKM